MKKLSLWAGIIGGLIVIFSAIGGASTFSSPSDLYRVNIAIGVSSLFWVAFGIGLLSTYFIVKNKEDSGELTIKPEPNTPEDTIRFQKIRNWVIAFFIFFEIVSSVEVWVLNNYLSNLTIINTEVIFDLAINIILFYLALELLRNKKNVLTFVLYSIIVMVIVEGVLSYIRLGWTQAATVIAFAPYFIYSIKAPFTQKNFRIANLIILPATLISATVFGYVGNININQLIKDKSRLEQQYVTQNSVTAQAYNIFLQKNYPTASDIQNVKDAVDKGNQRVAEILAAVAQIESEYNKQLPNIAQQKMLARLDSYREFLNLNVAQGNKMKEFMDYATTVDFENLSDKQATTLNLFKQEVDSFNKPIVDSVFRLNTDLK